MTENTPALLEIRDMSVTFRMYSGGLQQSDVRVVSDLSVSVRAGEVLAVAGASGSGKSVLAAAVLGILSDTACVQGHMYYAGQELTAARQAVLRGTEIALVPQSVAFLDPLLKVKDQLYVGRRKRKEAENWKRIFARLGLSEQTAQLYPFELSGGMARRVLAALALLTDARLIIADEPTPGMSAEQAAETMRLFREMAENGRAVMLITHDIDTAFDYADRVAVLYAGTAVEVMPAGDFRRGPDALRHPYSRALWRALPQHGFCPAAGLQPPAENLPEGCLFAPRCPLCTAVCRTAPPPMREVRGGEVRCCYGA